MDRGNPITISITPGTVVMAIVVLVAFWFAFVLRDLLLVILTAVVFASAIEPATVWFVRKGLPRVLAVVLIYLTTVVLLVSFFYFFIPPLTNEATNFFKDLPEFLESLEIESVENLGIQNGENTQGQPLTFNGVLVASSSGAFTIQDVQIVPTEESFIDSEGKSLGEQFLQFQDVIKTSSTGALAAASAIFGGLISFVLIIVLSFYFAVQERGLDTFLRLITPPKHQEYMLDLWKRAQVKIGLWLQGQLLLSLIVGVLVYIGLLVLNIEYALLLALVAAVLELIPVFGSILAAIPAVIIAFITGTPTLAILVIVLYVVVNQLQGNLIYPLVVQKVLGVPPLVVILAIIAGAQLGGFLGILIAVPVAAAVQEWIGDIQKGKEKLSYPGEDGSIR